MSAAEDAVEAGRSGPALFVRRPILAIVLNVLVAIAGVAGLIGAEVRELPDVDRPVVTIATDFPGAAPETVDREVTGVIEGAAGRIAGVKSISSASRFGNSRVTVEFADGVELDVAAADARDNIARIRNSLPAGVEDPRVVKADANAEAVMRLAVTSATLTPEVLSQIVNDDVIDRLLSAPGVADVQIFGERSEVYRVDVDLMQMAARGLTLADIRGALRDVAFDAPAGALSSPDQSIVVRTTAAVTTPVQFEALPVAPGVRLGDVARVTLGAAPGASVLRANGEAGVGLGIIRAAQSNTLSISQAVRAAVDDLRPVLPAGVDIFVTSDDAVFVTGAIREVAFSLGLAAAIVVAVIFLFLRDWRATLIPAATLPVALVGTLAAIWLAGFSVNVLTLLALVLATGMVVDDAIVVLENIVRRRAEGMGPRAAAVLGTRQVFFAVITTTATLAAVFVPLSFLPGQTGGLFREFGFTLAISVTLSSMVALSLCPVLASRLLGPARVAARPGLGDRFGDALTGFYLMTLRGALANPLVVVLVAALFAATAVFMAGGIRQELTPREDRSLALLSVTTPQGVSLEYTDAQMRLLEDSIAPLVASGEVTNVFAIAGSGGRSNRGFMVLTLATWGERDRGQQEIVAEINRRIAPVIGARAFVIQPNSLGIRGAGRGLTFAVAGGTYEALGPAAQALVDRLEADPRMGQVRLNYETTQAQLFIEVDRERAADLGVAIEGLGEALQAVLDGRTVAQVFVGERAFDVKLVSTADPVDDPGDLDRIFVRASGGEMIPISTFVRLEERAVAPELGRESQLRAVEITAGLTADLSLGDALAEVQAVAAEVLDPSMRIVPLAEAATLTETSSGLMITFGFAILIVFLVLAAQFESVVSAVIVMATVPLGLACAIFALALTGGSMNVYSQIGLVLLVGVMAKNGILIVEFADQLRDAGRDVRAAIEEACAIRLRPVMMTMASTVLGGLPLVYASGAGAEARVALGWIIVGGLGLATVATLYLTPVVYRLLAGLSRPRAAEAARLDHELAAVARSAPQPRPAG
ncbi:MAG: efflux RND transporter permease subunit [Paracoccaceae bacterium]|nr:MAG: efflux RND transporter permease subunit [Paracoccaceae bacterium]